MTGCIWGGGVTQKFLIGFVQISRVTLGQVWGFNPNPLVWPHHWIPWKIRIGQTDS